MKVLVLTRKVGSVLLSSVVDPRSLLGPPLAIIGIWFVLWDESGNSLPDPIGYGNRVGVGIYILVPRVLNSLPDPTLLTL